MTELLTRALRRIANVVETSLVGVGRATSLRYTPLTHSSRRV
jgi:hypothetical protein